MVGRCAERIRDLDARKVADLGLAAALGAVVCAAAFLLLGERVDAALLRVLGLS